MKRLFLTPLITLVFVVCYSQDDFEFEIEEEDNYDWQTPAGEYLDPTSYFSLHGYVNGVYGGKSDDWTAADPTKLGAPGQLLVPNTNNSSFQYDFALVISSELTERTRIAIESHYVSNPSGNGTAGPGGITIAITEATASYDIIPKKLVFSGGLFWSPFGIINYDWLGAQNTFSLVPRASGAYPVHYNERGIRLNGAFKLGASSALNYVVSLGNGVNNYNISGQSSFDRNDGKTFNARIGVFPGLGKDLNIGVSFMNGKMREAEDLSLPITDLSRYQNDVNVVGLDATYVKEALKLRGYWISGKEDLISDTSGNAPGEINRVGSMIEATYEISIGSESLKSIEPKVRFDQITVDNLEDNAGLETIEYSSSIISFGSSLIINDNFRFTFDYNVIDEKDGASLSNNRFFGKVIAKF